MANPIPIRPGQKLAEPAEAPSQPGVPPAQAAALQESLKSLHSLKPKRELFAEEVIQLIGKAAQVEAALLISCDTRASTPKLISSYGVALDFFQPLLSPSGRWVLLRCLNERRPNIIRAAEQNPFVPQNVISAVQKKGTLTIASLPFFHENNAPAGAVILFSSNPNHFSDALIYMLDDAVKSCVNGVPEPTGLAPAQPAGHVIDMRLEALERAPAAPSVDGPVALRLLQEERKKVAELERQLEQLSSFSTRFPELQAEVDRLNAQAREARKAAEQARAYAAQLEAARAEAEARARAAAETLELLLKSRDDLQEKLYESLAAGQQRVATAAQIEEEYRQLSEEKRKTEELREALLISEAARAAAEAQLAKAQQQVTAVQAAHLETQAALQARTEALAAAQAEAQRLTLKLHTAEEEITRLRNEMRGIEGLREQYEATRSALQGSTEQLTTAQTEMQLLRAKASLAEEEVNRLRTEMRVLERLRDQHEALRSEVRALQGALDAARETLAAKIREDAEKSAAWTERLKRVESERQEAEDKLLRMRSEMQDAREARSALEFLQRERDELAKQVAAFQKIGDERAQLKARVTELEQKLLSCTGPPRSAARTEVQAAQLSELERQLLDAFREEAAEGIEACERLLMMLERQGGADSQLVSALFRRFHTLKGAASAVGLTAVAAQLHDGESLLQTLEETKRIADSRIIDFLLRLLDSVGGLIDQALGIENGERKIIQDMGLELARLCVGIAPCAGDGANAGTSVRALETDANIIRVDTARLDELVEKLTAIDQARGKMFREIRTLAALQDKLARDSASFGVEQLKTAVDTLTEVSTHLSVMRVSLQRQITGLRLVPLDSVFRRLQRAARDAARQTGKQVELNIEGGDVHVERRTLEALNASLIHIVRNAVAHGIERPEVRDARGKPLMGSILVRAGFVSDVASGDPQVEVTVRDDGAGINFDKVLQKARAKGLVASDVQPDHNELLSLIFCPGFSTGDEVTELAGRGIGLDVVAQEIAAVQGTVRISSETGLGSTVTLTVPVSPVVS